MKQSGLRIFIITFALSMVAILYACLNIAYFAIGKYDYILMSLGIMLGFCLLLFFTWALDHLNRMYLTRELETNFQVVRKENQDKIMALMDEQRNDIINAISVVTAYLQLGKYDQAKAYLEFMVADQLDRYEYHNSVASEQPWISVLEQKQEFATVQGIELVTDIGADIPEDEKLSNVLARLMGNLLDYAFNTVSHVKSPRVWLRWFRTEEAMILDVSTNGPILSVQEQNELLNPGNITAANPVGWRLLICRNIASEIGGRFQITSDGYLTTYRFILPHSVINQ